MSNLITPTLLDAFDWLRHCPSDWKERALEGLKNTLNRAPWNPTPAIQRGLDFERKTCALLELNESAFLNNFPGCTPDILKFQAFCRGGRQQVTLKKDLVVGKDTYCLYGKADVLFPSLIIDLKTTARWKGAQSYLTKNQHLLYAYCSGIVNFKYLVAEFDDVNGLVSHVHDIDTVVDIEGAKMTLSDRIRDAITLMQDDGDLWKAYTTKFNRW